MLKISRKTAIIFISIATIISLIFVGSFLKNKYDYTDYIKTEACISKTILKYQGTNKTPVRYVIYNFTVDDKAYEVEGRVFNHWFKKEGNIVFIRYNPSNPNQIENKYLITTKVGMALFLFVFASGLTYCVIKDMKKYKY